jgi:agmatinase
VTDERSPHGKNFLGIAVDQNRRWGPRAALLPIAYDGTVSYQRGARRGPLAILDASTHLESYDEELEVETWQKVAIQTLPALAPDHADPVGVMERIERAAREVVAAGQFLIGLGGEHSVTAPLVRAVRSTHPRLGVLQLDAHADLRDTFEGSPYSHACVMHRILDDDIPFAQVGVRSFSAEERILMRERGICTVLAAEAVSAPVGRWIGGVLRALPEEIYVTVDLDALDPAIMPATGTPEPGGLDWYRVLTVLREVASAKQIVGFDVVELAPLPGVVAPDFLAAKLVYRLLGYSLLNRR